LQKNIGFALISTRCNAGDQVEVLKEGRPIGAVLQALPFI
jgi:hypothetical protein